jgi:hypothetical protein
MSLKKLNENPTIADQIIIEIDTPVDGCFEADPYKVDNIKIYYVQRTFSGNDKQYDKEFYDEQVKKELDAAIKLACADPTEHNLLNVDILRDRFNKTIKSQTFYFSDPLAIQIIGTEDFPAWLSTDVENSQLVHISETSSGETQYGKFQYHWNPLGAREGDYFICWSWSPYSSGDKLSSHIHFSLGGSTQLTTSIPTHFTQPNKYSILMERYLPSIFKMKMSSTDLAPQVLQEFNEAVAKGFTFIEDQANQITDLLDANSTHESLLSYLARFFNLELYSGDPTLWRRQIKNAIPLFKNKGTLEGLKTALLQAGITLSRYSQMWQVKSKYTFQEYFKITDSTDFELSKLMILPVDLDNFELYYREGNGEWQELNSDYVTFSESDNIVTMSWLGEQLSVSPIELKFGDSIRVIYKTLEIPNNDEQIIELYVRTLPLSDDRDELDQEYPIKNWNVRLIEDDDPLFDLIVPDRNPFFDPLIYGWIRTEFPYSENVYNMDEYNGSIRESLNPCDIDKEFVDSCHSCISSKYALDLEIEHLSNDRIIEAQKIIREYTPFHAILHAINLTGSVNEFIQSPIESIKKTIRIEKNDFTISGNAQLIFDRIMLPSERILRNELANVTTLSNGSGQGFNEYISLYTPNFSLDQIGLDKNPSYTYLEVLSPSINAGVYAVENPDKNYVNYVDEFDTLTEPLDESSFTFRISNEKMSKSSTSIYQDDLFVFKDSAINLFVSNLKTQKETNSWKIYIDSYDYEIVNTLPDGSIILDDPDHTLPISNTSNISYELKNNSNQNIITGTTGALIVTRRGRVDLSGTINIRGINQTFTNVSDLFDKYQEFGKNFYLKYLDTQYPVLGTVNGNPSQIYIGNYTSGDVAGVTTKLYHRLANNKTGYFHYKGIKLITPTNYESSLGIANGTNPIATPLENNLFKENFLILIDTEYFAIKEIDGQIIYLAGPHKNWKTTGTSVSYTILKYEGLGASIQSSTRTPEHDGYNFNLIDRRGNDIIEISTEDVSSLSMLMATTLNQGSGTSDLIGQEENISFSIEMVEENS